MQLQEPLRLPTTDMQGVCLLLNSIFPLALYLLQRPVPCEAFPLQGIIEKPFAGSHTCRR